MPNDRRSLAVIMLAFACFIGRTGIAQTNYEILHDTFNASGWFGGDNRTGSNRSVGVGQSVLIDTSIQLTDFSFYFDGRFDFAMNPDGFGHEVTLTLNIRDSLGAILQTLQKIVPDTFQGGWITWSGINRDVAAYTTIIFTTYLNGAFDINQYTSSQACDFNAGYSGGVRYGKDDSSDAEMEQWVDWSTHSWDSDFWLQGTIITADVPNESSQRPSEFALSQNYPNPFNPGTDIRFYLPARQGGITDHGIVSLRVYDVMGREVGTLLNKVVEPGEHAVTFDGRGLASGVYFYQLRASGVVQTRKMALLR